MKWTPLLPGQGCLMYYGKLASTDITGLKQLGAGADAESRRKGGPKKVTPPCKVLKWNFAIPDQFLSLPFNQFSPPQGLLSSAISFECGLQSE